MFRSVLLTALLASIALWPALAGAQTPPPAPPPAAVLFENVRVFDGTSERVSPPRNVLVVGNKIQTIADTPIAPPAGAALTRIAGNGRTLMPGLIDAHWHAMMAAISLKDGLAAHQGYVNIVAAKAAEDTLMRGFTSVRDLAGPTWGPEARDRRGDYCRPAHLAVGGDDFANQRACRLSVGQRTAALTVDGAAQHRNRRVRADRRWAG